MLEFVIEAQPVSLQGSSRTLNTWRDTARRSGDPVDQLTPAAMIDVLERRTELSAEQANELCDLMAIHERTGHATGMIIRDRYGERLGLVALIEQSSAERVASGA